MAFDGPPTCATSVANWTASVAVRVLEPATVAQVGLGTMMFAAGVHKSLDPPSWLAYVVPWLTPVLIISPVTLVLANSVLKVGFDMAIVTDHYTASAGAVAAVSLLTACLYLAIVFVIKGGLFGDVSVRDVGLAGLMWAMLTDPLRRSTRTP